MRADRTSAREHHTQLNLSRASPRLAFNGDRGKHARIRPLVARQPLVVPVDAIGKAQPRMRQRDLSERDRALHQLSGPRASEEHEAHGVRATRAAVGEALRQLGGPAVALDGAHLGEGNSARPDHLMRQRERVVRREDIPLVEGALAVLTGAAKDGGRIELIDGAANRAPLPPGGCHQPDLVRHASPVLSRPPLRPESSGAQFQAVCE